MEVDRVGAGALPGTHLLAGTEGVHPRVDGARDEKRRKRDRRGCRDDGRDADGGDRDDPREEREVQRLPVRPDEEVDIRGDAAGEPREGGDRREFRRDGEHRRRDGDADDGVGGDHHGAGDGEYGVSRSAEGPPVTPRTEGIRDGT